MLAKDKPSSLLWKVVTYDRKKFYNIGHKCLCIKTMEQRIFMQNKNKRIEGTTAKVNTTNSLKHK